jgi:hypothetical protein
MSKPEKLTGEVASLARVTPDEFLSFHLKVKVCGFEASAASAVQLLALLLLVVSVVVDDAEPVMMLPAGRFVAVLEHPENFNASAAVSVFELPDVVSGGVKAILPVTVVQLTVPLATVGGVDAPDELAPTIAAILNGRAAAAAIMSAFRIMRVVLLFFRVSTESRVGRHSPPNVTPDPG